MLQLGFETGWIMEKKKKVIKYACMDTAEITSDVLPSRRNESAYGGRSGPQSRPNPRPGGLGIMNACNRVVWFRRKTYSMFLSCDLPNDLCMCCSTQHGVFQICTPDRRARAVLIISANPNNG